MKEQLVATGGVVSAIGASTCCLLPLALVSVGVSGAWIGYLTALAPYQPYFLVAAVLFLGAGFWLVYYKPATGCGVQTENSLARRIVVGTFWVKVVLWLAASLVAASVGLEFGLGVFL